MTIQEIFEAVRRVEIRTNRLVNDMMVGAYLSHFKGRGMDFEELRDYMPGDDVRDIDWNVTYRMGRPFVKRYREERELGVILALDISASGRFGSNQRSKREFATEIAATLAFSAARSSDKVGLLLFSDQVELFLPPRKGRSHILRITKEMLFHEAKHKRTNIPQALTFLNHVIRRRSIVFLFTDFLQNHDQESLATKPHRRDMVQDLGMTNARHDLVCVHLHDPRESQIPNAGLLTLEDVETGEVLEVDSGRAGVRQTYAEKNAERLTQLDSALRLAGVETLRFSSGEPYAQILQRFFETRRGRRRG
jgi:uncharacterized protein (DUF58 family)